MKVALTLYTLRDFVQTPSEMEKTFKKVKKIGYNTVQLSALGPVDTRELKKMLDDAGLKVCATHVSFDRLQNDFNNLIEEHRILGCPHIAIGSLPSNMRNYEGYSQFAKLATEIGRKILQHGMDFSYHNHAFELVRFNNGKTGLEIIYEESDKNAVLAEIDTYWIQYGGGDPAYWIKKMKDRIKVVHFKDMGVIDNLPTMVEIGEGNLNWPEIIESCRYSGAEWLVVEQDTCQRDPFESVKISLQNLMAMGLNP
ncbi:MAG: sugar phosphate isomerase/epimerase [Candidatus Omnitrophica bacterium]|nr:sugar phosphate isomerase/epimerase [Candidatus Omnitrophota bacterium]